MKLDAVSARFAADLPLVLGAGAGALTVRSLARRVRRLREVSPDLRTPLLLAPLEINAFTRGPVRRVMGSARPASPTGVRISDRRIPDGADGIRILVAERREPSTAPRPLLFWMHGGGYVLGTPEQDLLFLTLVLDRIDAVVVSVDYRLAPRFPFPAPLDDCIAAYGWVIGHAEELGIDHARVAMGGKSAGGGLAAALVQHVVDHGPMTPVFQLLVYPMLDATTDVRGRGSNKDRFVWSGGSNRYGWRSYLGGNPAGTGHPPYSVPAARERLNGLPPAWIGVGTLDLFLDEDTRYAQRLRSDGVDCLLHLVEGAHHGFDAARPDAVATRAFSDSMLAALEDALLGGGALPIGSTPSSTPPNDPGGSAGDGGIAS